MDGVVVEEKVVDLVMDFVEKEVQEEVQRLSELVACRPGNAKEYSCPFCPYRCFRNRKRLLDHIKTYHTKTRLYTANVRSQAQWTLLVALFNQGQALGALQSAPDQKHLLLRSAELLKKWNPIDAQSVAYMKRNNEFEVVLCLCSDGPAYKLRSQTHFHVTS